jgi:hypothetical protein
MYNNVKWQCIAITKGEKNMIKNEITQSTNSVSSSSSIITEVRTLENQLITNPNVKSYIITGTQTKRPILSGGMEVGPHGIALSISLGYTESFSISVDVTKE